MADDIQGITRPDRKLLWRFIIAALLAGPMAPIVFLPLYFKYRTLQYRFDDVGVSMSWGYFWRREIHLTYARIQDIHLSRGLVERWLGLGTILVLTASGSASAEMAIVGLPQFEDVRDLLYDHMRGAREGGRGRCGQRRRAGRSHRAHDRDQRRAPRDPDAPRGVMYDLFRSLILRLARAPLEPPDPPAGSTGSVDTFRASKRLLTLQLISAAIGAILLLLPLGVGALAALAANDQDLLPIGVFLAFGFVCVLGLVWFRYVLIRLDYDMRQDHRRGDDGNAYAHRDRGHVQDRETSRRRPDAHGWRLGEH